jgi:radical SAM protein with 4Fe4S-binding SPASM domain
MKTQEKLKTIFHIIRERPVAGTINLVKHFYDLRTREERLQASPISAQIEPTTRCNLKCEMCEHSFKEFNKRDLTLERFRKILDDFPFLKNITLQGLGEPLLNQDIYKMIHEAKRRNVRIGITTNATLLDKVASENLINSKLDWMYISLDSVDKELYEKIRRGANFDIVKRNIIKFFELKGNAVPKTNFWTLLLKENIKYIKEIVLFADSLGVEKIILQSLHNWGHETFDIIRNKRIDKDDRLSILVEELKNMEKKVEVEITTNIHETNVKCNWPWRSLYITTDGFVTPCCMQGADPDLINFGNVFDNDLNNILNNDKYRKFRSELNSTNIPKICKGCPAYFNQKTIKV